MKIAKLLSIITVTFFVNNAFSQNIKTDISLNTQKIENINTESHGIVSIQEIMDSEEAIKGIIELKKELIKLDITSKNILDIKWKADSNEVNYDQLAFILRRNQVRSAPRTIGGRVLTGPIRVGGNTGNVFGDPNLNLNNNTGILGGGGMVVEVEL